MLDPFISFLSLFVGFLGFLVIIFITMSFKKSALFNIYLLVLFFFIAVRLVHIGLLGFYDATIINAYNMYLGPIYLFAIPSLYLYFESLYADRVYFNPRHLLHLIFPSVNLFLNSFQHHFSEMYSAHIETVQAFSVLGFIISYSSICLYLGYKKLWRKSPVFVRLSSEHEAKMRHWTMFLFVIMCILSFRLVYSIFSEIQEETRVLGYQGSLVMSVIWLVVFIKVLRSPELLYGYPKLKNTAAPIDQIPIETSSLWRRGDVDTINVKDVKLRRSIGVKIAAYLTKVEDYVSLHHPFRNPKYSIKDLAHGLNIPVSHLVYIFKYHCEMPFVEYRNHQRIKDAVNFVLSNFLKTQTLESLAIAVGFTSYNSFFVSFKKHTGSSPKLFLESLSS